MLSVMATETIACTPDELLAFVMDPRRYATVDRKIRLVHRLKEHLES